MYETNEENRRIMRGQIVKLYRSTFPLIKINMDGYERFGLIGAKHGIEYEEQEEKVFTSYVKVKKLDLNQRLAELAEARKPLPKTLRYLKRKSY